MYRDRNPLKVRLEVVLLLTIHTMTAGKGFEFLGCVKSTCIPPTICMTPFMFASEMQLPQDGPLFLPDNATALLAMCGVKLSAIIPERVLHDTLAAQNSFQCHSYGVSWARIVAYVPCGG